MTDGPFYPSLAYRARSLDWDADLTTVRGRAPDGQPLPKARGEHLDLHGVVRDGSGRAVDGAEIEIWQCDAFGSYRHPRGAGDRIDAGFQGFGATRSDGRGGYRFRTIRPVPYPGRTPHIHVKLRHPAFGEVTSQLFVVGEPGNAGDFLYRSLAEGDRQEVELRLQRAPAGRRGDVDRRARSARRRCVRRRVGAAADRRLSRRRSRRGRAARSSSRRRRRRGRRGWRG